MQKRSSLWKYTVDVAAIIGCLGTVFFGWLAVKVTRDAARDAREIAVQSGSFDKPNLRLLLGTNELENDQMNLVFLGAALTSDKAINVGHLPFIIRNTGKKTAKAVEVLDQLPKPSRAPLNGIVEMKTEGFLSPRAEFHTEMKEIGNFSYIYYSTEAINPGTNIGFSDPFIMEPTEFEGDFETKDKFKVRVAVQYSIQQHLTISAEDQEKQDYSLSVAILNVHDERALKDRVSRILGERLSKRRSQLPYLTSLWATLQENAYFAYAEPKMLVDKDGLQVYEVKYPFETIRVLTVMNRRRYFAASVYGLTTLIVIATLTLLVLRLRRRTREAKA